MSPQFLILIRRARISILRRDGASTAVTPAEWTERKKKITALEEFYFRTRTRAENKFWALWKNSEGKNRLRDEDQSKQWFKTSEEQTMQQLFGSIRHKCFLFSLHSRWIVLIRNEIGLRYCAIDSLLFRFQFSWLIPKRRPGPNFGYWLRSRRGHTRVCMGEKGERKKVSISFRGLPIMKAFPRGSWTLIKNSKKVRFPMRTKTSNGLLLEPAGKEWNSEGSKTRNDQTKPAWKRKEIARLIDMMDST